MHGSAKLWFSLILIPAVCVVAGLFARSAVKQFSATSSKQVQGGLYDTFDVSQDGNRIVFSAASDSGKALYLLDLKTQRVTQLTNTSEYANYAAFSPSGKSIVYAAGKDLDHPRYLFVRSIDGKQVRQLTSATQTADSYPYFSSSGEQIVFARASTFYAGARGKNTWDHFDVYTINVNGTHLRRITHGNYSGVIRPKFSPDIRTILFEETGTDDQGNVAMHISQVDTAGRQPIKSVVKFGSYADFAPYFFPDGRRIAFASNSGGTVHLYTLSLSGGQPVALVPGENGGSDPVVTGDGDTVFFQGNVYTGGGLWRVNANGSNPYQIDDGSLFTDPLHWKPKSLH